MALSLVQTSSADDSFLQIVRNSQSRKADTDKRLRFYYSEQADALRQRLTERFSSKFSGRMQLLHVNLVRRIVNKVATVYLDDPS